jgi:hypothetical protein
MLENSTLLERIGMKFANESVEPVITQTCQSLVGLWFLPKLVIFPCLSPFRRPNLKFFPFRLVVFSVFSLDHLSDLLFCVVLPKKSRPQDFCFILT